MCKSQRPDLAAMLGPLGRALIRIERPILGDHGLGMWEYSVLVGLGDEPVRSQGALAESIGADKSRVIPVLDDLESRGMISRTRDPGDRRIRLVSITTQGRELRDTAQAAIRRSEEQLLARLSAADRTAFLNVLRELSQAVQQSYSDHHPES